MKPSTSMENRGHKTSYGSAQT